MTGIMMSHMATAVQAASGGLASLALGTITVGTALWNYGMGDNYFYGFNPNSGGWGAAYGSTTGPASGAARITRSFSSNQVGYGIFRIVLVPGNYGDYTVDNAGLINGSFININLTIDGVTVELSPVASGGDPVTYSYVSTNNAVDNFSLSTKIGQTLSVSLVPSQTIYATYTAGLDYTTVGFALDWMASTLTMTKSNWTNSGGLAALAALTSGTKFAVEVLGYNETPPNKVTITLTSNWTDNGTTFTATASIPQISNTATASNIYLIQAVGGGGGTLTTITLKGVQFDSTSDYYSHGSAATRNGTAIAIIGRPPSTKIENLLLLNVGDTLTMTTNLGTATVTLATVFTTSDAGGGLLYYNATSVESVAFSFIQDDIIFSVYI